MSSRPAHLLVMDIIESIEKIERYIVDLDHDAFMRDQKTVDAVVWNLQVIGEAANRIPDVVKEQHPEIEWRRIVGLRNRIVHGYFGLDLEIIWEILQHELPALKATISDIHLDDG